MAIIMTENLKMVNEEAMESLPSQTVHDTWETGVMTDEKEMENSGTTLRENTTKGNGAEIRNKEEECS